MNPIRVLVATDSAQLVRALSDAASSAGFEFVQQDNLIGLYSALTKWQPDVLLVDGDLPRLALEAAIGFLRQRAPNQFPIVLLASSAADADPAQLAQAIGAVDLVAKDARPDKLTRALAKVGRRAAPPGSTPAGAFAMPDTGDHEEHSGEHPTATGGAADFLVVDDDPAVTRLIKRILESRYLVHVANDGATAIELCRTRSYRGVFCDLSMPLVSGADVYRAVLAEKPELAPKIVFVTAHALDQNDVEFFMGLKNHIVHKPFSLRDILAAATKVVGAG